MCRVVSYIYKCNHTSAVSEPCQHAASGYACSGRSQDKHLALSDACPGCLPAYQKWLSMQAAGSEKKRMLKEQEESRRLNEWARTTLFDTAQ